ncbi:MAG: 50S ribosomal protein L5 [bacterium]|nr:50S ribosomal protein L5 [bacterium]
MKAQSIKTKEKEAFNVLKEKAGYKNPMQAPRLRKVVISAGVGSFKDKKKFATVEDRLAKITGQKAAPRAAKKSIAAYKSRQGDTVGYQTTLRGPRMYGFLDKLIAIALPRVRDFRGIPEASVDEIGNLTIGVREHTIFPEASDEDLRDVFGMAITVVTSATSKDEARAFFDYLGFPFAKATRK